MAFVLKMEEDWENFKLSEEEEKFERGLISQKEYAKYVKKKLKKVFEKVEL